MVEIDMAILIPSKNIYAKQNPKVRDNVIERIEVSAVEVVPDNEYETPIYNENIANLSLKSQETTNEDLQETWLINTGAYLFTGACAYAGYNSQKYHEQKVYIPKLKDNSFINKLLLGVDDNDNQNIKTTFVGTKNKGTTSGTWYGNFITSGKNELIVTKGAINYSQPTETKKDERYDIPKEISYTYQSENRGNPTATAKLIDIGNLSTVSFDEETKNGIEYYTLQLKILCGIRIVYMGGYDNGMQGTISNCPFVMSGSYEEYIPTNIEITVYGNTIGIDLTDKTVYIPETDKTSKKVHSIDGNELMQTSNYSVKYENPLSVTIGSELGFSVGFASYELYGSNLSVGQILHYNNEEAEVKELPEETGDPYTIKIKPNGEWAKATGKTITAYLSKTENNAITENYKNTKYLYAKGKETATIRCSISDYYDGEQKVIAIDNSTGKMSFDIGDRVIPMVYGADGKDRPMSTYQDGSQKEFEVIGIKKFYDGAVWQELSVQEC